MTRCMWCSTSSTVDPALVADAPDQPAKLGDLAMRQPAGRLVEQQQARPRGQRARQLDPLARAERQAGSRAQRDIAQIEHVEQIPGGIGQRRLAPPRRGQPQRVGQEIAAAARVPADPHIVEDALRAEQRQVLKGARDADLGDAMRRARRAASFRRTGYRPGSACRGG